MFRRTYKYRLYPTPRQSALLNEHLDEACRLYNAALQERRDAWRIGGVSVSFRSQRDQFKEIREAGDVSLPNYACGVDVLQRVDLAYASFFRRLKRNRRAGFPRFKPRRRYNSLTFRADNGGCKLDKAGRLKVQGVGPIRLKQHRPLEGVVKTTTIKQEGGRWFVCFCVEQDVSPLRVSTEVCGVDLGLTAFITLSDGSTVDNPRSFEKAQKELRRLQRRVARRRKGSRRRQKAALALKGLNGRIGRRRGDFHHKLSRRIVNRYGLIAVEDLNVKGLAASILAKQVADAGWASFVEKLAYKAESAGRVLVRVDPRGTSQVCSGCGRNVPKSLRERRHLCPTCGLDTGRDHNAALNILRAGLALQAST